jgi:hypothetical protein
MVTNFEYGYEQNIKDRVAGKASTQLTPQELTKANRYASEVINAALDKPEGFGIVVTQTGGGAGTITSNEPFANSISAIAEKLAAQALRFDFNEQEEKSKVEWKQAMDELAEIKKSLAKLNVVTSEKTIASFTPSTFPSNANANFISGVRKRLLFFNQSSWN